MNWYAMGANAPSQIDEARDRARAANAGDNYEDRERHMALALNGLSRSQSIRAWRQT